MFGTIPLLGIGIMSHGDLVLRLPIGSGWSKARNVQHEKYLGWANLVLGWVEFGPNF